MWKEVTEMDKKRKELAGQYKQRTVMGGVFRINNTKNGKYWLAADDDLRGARNRHDFSVMTGSCVVLQMAADWRAQEAADFVFEELETLEKKPDQTQKEFREELGILLEIWREKLDPALRY